MRLAGEECPGAAAGHKEQCPERGHLTADPSLCALRVLASAFLLFSFDVPMRWHCQPKGRNLLCHEVCPDFMCNTQLGKPFAVEDFYRLKTF